MSTIHRLPDVAAIEQQASAWIARLHAHDVTADDMARFNEWREAHPRHAQTYEAMSATVDEIKRAGRIVRAVSFGNAMNAAADVAHDDGASRIRRHSVFRLGMAAAAMVIVLGMASAWWTMQADPRTLFQTAIGEHATIELQDGSTLELNSNSRARVDYSEAARIIRLERGEGFFQVHHDTARPFWVVAGGSWVRAVGTAFNVHVRPAGVRVVVTEGTVKVAANASSGAEMPTDSQLALAPVYVLTAGQQAQIEAGTTQIRAVASPEMTRVAAWRRGKLYFENERLESVVEELGRYTSARITIQDDSLRQLPIGGTFQANARGVGTLLGMLREGFGLRIREEDDHIYIEDAAAAD